MPGTYELTRSDSQFMWSLKAVNGEAILTSERHHSKEGAMNGISSCKVSSVLDFRYERKDSSAGQAYFVLRGGDHEVIGTSVMYSSPAERDRGIDVCRANGPTATLVDRT